MIRPLRTASSRPLCHEPPAAPPERLEVALAEVGRGDEHAFERVYGRASASVYGIVHRVLRDRTQSDEVTRELFLHMWREASSFDESKGSAMAWIMTIAHQRAVDRVRAERSSTERRPQAAVPDMQASSAPVVHTVGGRLERAAAQDALAALTPTQRSAVVLAYYGGLTYGEVAERLGVPLGTVQTRIRDGLIRMRDHLHAKAPSGRTSVTE